MELGFWGEAVLNNAAAWTLTYLAYSTLLLGAVALAARYGGLSPATESTLWRRVLLLTPAITSLRVAAEHVEGWVRTGPDALAVAGATGSVLIAATVVSASLALLRSGSLGGAALAERRRLADRRPVEDDDLIRSLRDLAHGSGRPCPRISRSDRIHGPVAIGSDEICVPSGFTRFDPSVRRAVLAHELGHLARRDPRWRTLSRLVERVFFFQPLQRLATRRLRETSEFLADDFAVRSLGSPEPLVAALTALARTSVGLRTAAGFAPGSLLLRRARRALGVDAPGRSPPRWLLAGGVVVLLTLTWLSPVVVPAYDCRITGVAPEVTSWLLLHF